VKNSQKFDFPGPAKKYLKKPQGFNKQNRTSKRPAFQQKKYAAAVPANEFAGAF
jgi:hypothetical protein